MATAASPAKALPRARPLCSFRMKPAAFALGTRTAPSSTPTTSATSGERLSTATIRAIDIPPLPRGARSASHPTGGDAPAPTAPTLSSSAARIEDAERKRKRGRPGTDHPRLARAGGIEVPGVREEQPPTAASTRREGCEAIATLGRVDQEQEGLAVGDLGHLGAQ